MNKENLVTEESESYYLNQNTSEEYDQLKADLRNLILNLTLRKNLHLFINDYNMDGSFSV